MDFAARISRFDCLSPIDYRYFDRPTVKYAEACTDSRTAY